ncbi:MAG: hypothetical protein EBZ89_05675, partial [Chloroflexi bacterium]|nr:hypothetical protein [Chloroflexota bacterium]
IGGRIWTDSSLGFPVEMGAGWIHGSTGNPLVTLAQAAGARLVTHDVDSAREYQASGAPLASAQVQRLAVLRASMMAAVTAGQNASTDQALRTTILSGVGYATLTAEDQRLVDYLISTEYEHEYAASSEALSTWWFDDDVAFPGVDQVLPDGYGALTDLLARGLDIRLSQRVTNVSIAGNTVVIAATSTTGGASSTLVADRVVVTLPLGVLKSGAVTFAPALPAIQQAAIGGLGMGVLNRCTLAFPTVFWDPSTDWIEYVTPRRGEWVDWISLARPTGRPILRGRGHAPHVFRHRPRRIPFGYACRDPDPRTRGRRDTNGYRHPDANHGGNADRNADTDVRPDHNPDPNGHRDGLTDPHDHRDRYTNHNAVGDPDRKRYRNPDTNVRTNGHTGPIPYPDGHRDPKSHGYAVPDTDPHGHPDTDKDTGTVGRAFPVSAMRMREG